MEIKYIFSLDELFERVQMENIFPDGKTFVDCTPKKSLAFIRERYELEKNNVDFNLSAFVHKYFEEPKEAATDYKSDTGQPVG